MAMCSDNIDIVSLCINGRDKRMREMYGKNVNCSIMMIEVV